MQYVESIPHLRRSIDYREIELIAQYRQEDEFHIPRYSCIASSDFWIYGIVVWALDCLKKNSANVSAYIGIRYSADIKIDAMIT
jgi:hypothetical protein